MKYDASASWLVTSGSMSSGLNTGLLASTYPPSPRLRRTKRGVSCCLFYRRSSGNLPATKRHGFVNLFRQLRRTLTEAEAEILACEKRIYVRGDADIIVEPAHIRLRDAERAGEKGFHHESRATDRFDEQCDRERLVGTIVENIEIGYAAGLAGCLIRKAVTEVSREQIASLVGRIGYGCPVIDEIVGNE